MKNKILLYFPYKLRDNISGSSLRPNMMTDAFRRYAKNAGKELIVVSGTTNERKKMVKNFDKKFLSEIDYCYFENATLPFWLTDKDKMPRSIFWETKFLRNLKKQKIPIGIFYRDVYWKFKDYYPLKGFKLFIMTRIYNKEKSFYDGIASKIFLPSISMNDFCNFKTETFGLPPGIADILPTENKFDKKTLFYVGSLNENSGLNDIINILKIIEKYNLDFNVKIVCPKKDKVKEKEKFKIMANFSNVEIKHLHGKELKKEYNNVSIAVIPRKVNSYNSFAMPIKLFEYIENGLPIISSNVTETAKFIEDNSIGYVYKDHEHLIEVLNKISNSDNYLNLLNNINDIKEDNSWESRVLLIDNLLSRKEEF